MDNDVYPVNGLGEVVAVVKVTTQQLNRTSALLEVASVDVGTVKYTDLMAPSDELIHDMRADETCST